jgi:putative cardiolipin synthase
MIRCSYAIVNLFLSLIILILLVSACTSLVPIPDELDTDEYSCMQEYDPQSDPMVRKNGDPAPESSFLTVNRSIEALEWRQAMADKAEHTLDIQYFLWQNDDTGLLLISHVLAAADRGVRVRLLMDDFLSHEWSRKAIILNSHPEIEIRVFNPFKKMRGSMGQRAFELFTDLDRLNHRMHNKLFLSDQRVAMIGGRNIGNDYFGAGKKYSYRDYDLIAMGPVVEELVDSFETFWNSAWSYPLKTLEPVETSKDINELRNQLADTVSSSKLLAAEFQVAPRDWSDLINAAKERVITGRARVLFDCPPSYDDRQFPVQTAFTLKKVSLNAEQEILIISPYVVPLEQLFDHFRQAIDQGKNVRIYTNSMASSDHTYAFSGYAKHRPELLSIGVMLRELKPDAAISEIHLTPSSTSKYLSMHAKLVVFDQQRIYIGSMNLDPRSGHWNTELGLLIDSPELAVQIYEDFSGDFHPESTWLVEMRDQEGRQQTYWVDREREITKEPSRSLGQNIASWFYSLFPLDEHL